MSSITARPPASETRPLSLYLDGSAYKILTESSTCPRQAALRVYEQEANDKNNPKQQFYGTAGKISTTVGLPDYIRYLCGKGLFG